MLERILEITRVLVQNQLEQKFQNYELANLVVGYDVFTKDKNGEIPEQTPQRFSVEWNNTVVKREVVSQKSDDPSFNDFMSSLFSSLQKTIDELSPKLNNKVAYLYISLVITRNESKPNEMIQAISFVTRCAKCKPSDRRRRWIVDGDCKEICC